MCEYSEQLTRNRQTKDITVDRCFIHKPSINRKGALDHVPHDEKGMCLFHSEMRQWKSENNFRQRLQDLITDLGGTEGVDKVDLSGIVVADSSENALRIENISVNKPFILANARCSTKVIFSNVTFPKGTDFRNAIFEESLHIDQCTWGKTDFEAVTFKRALWICGSIFSGAYTIFDYARFNHSLIVRDSSFGGMVTFMEAHFLCADYTSSAAFLNTVFENHLGLEKTNFECAVKFRDVVFWDSVECINTRFQPVRYFSDFQHAPHSFNNISIEENAILSFTGASEVDKIFNEKTDFSFKDDRIKGKLVFANANFSYLSKASRDRILKQEKLGNVEIGPGCIKYRHQTAVKVLNLSKGNQAVILEIARTFANYFMMQNGINLGIEILERNEHQISFFYYSDEDISAEEFESKLNTTEVDLWSLLLLRPDSMPVAAPPGHQIVDQKQMINAVDGILSLMNIFYKIGLRATVNDWDAKDTGCLLKALELGGEIPFNPEQLHQAILNHYSPDHMGMLISSFSRQTLPAGSVAETRGLGNADSGRTTFIKELEALFSEDQIPAVLIKLRNAFEQTNKELHEEVLMQMAAFSSTERNFRLSLISSEEKNIQDAKIRYAILKLMKELPAMS